MIFVRIQIGTVDIIERLYNDKLRMVHVNIING